MDILRMPLRTHVVEETEFSKTNEKKTNQTPTRGEFEPS